MANIIKLGSLLLDGVNTEPGSKYKPGQKIRISDGDSLSWIVVNDLLIADRPLLVNISWDDLAELGLVYGAQMLINGQRFICRLLQVGRQDGEPNEWDAALDTVGYSNDLWHWKDVCFWGQELVASLHRAVRGHNSARHRDRSERSYRNIYHGFRPVLQPIPSIHLDSGSRICAIGGQSVLYGTLLEMTDYDILIQPEQSSILEGRDDWKFYAKLPDGTIAIDDELMAVQTIEEA